ncbi:MAG: PAS domain S-box protein, partial [Methanoregulaceae archaeon]|nr:PAS domain S-box protein [Methanoregulaceae archaeon]
MSDPRKKEGGERSTKRAGEQGYRVSADIEQVIDERYAGLEAEIEALKREIGDLKQREADQVNIGDSLKESEDNLRNLILNTPDGIILNDDRGVILEWNIGMEEIFGIPREDAIGSTILDVASRCIPEDSHAENIETWVSSIIEELDNAPLSSSKNPFKEISISRPHGKQRFIEAKNFHFTSHGRMFYGGIVRDITERRHAKDALIEKEEELQNLIESSGDGIITTDEEGRITRWNNGAELLTGLAAKDVLGAPAWEIQSQSVTDEWAGPDPLTLYHAAWDRLLHDDSDQHFKGLFDGQIRTPGGDTRFIQQRVFRIPTRSGFRIGAIIRDITEQKKADERLIENQEELQNLIESSNDGIIITDEEGRITRWNNGAELLTGLAAKDVLGLPMWELQASRSTDEMHKPDPATWYRNTWDRLLHDETDPFYRHVINDQLKSGNNDIRDVQVRVFRIPTRKGFRIGAIIRDITEQQQMERAIRENERKYRTLVEMSPDIIVIHQDGKLVYANPAMEKLLTTARPEELIGMDVFDLIHPDFHPVVQQNIEDDLKGIITPTTEIRIVRGDGTHVIFEGRGRQISYNGNPAILVVIRDITDRKNAEMQLKEYAENLKRSNEDLELFAYIATHDLQEPIRGIVTYSELLLNQCKEGKNPQIEKYLKIIENSGLRMNTLVSDLREYSRVRSQARPPEPVDAGTILTDALSNLQLLIKETRASITHEHLPVVLADAMQ